MNAAGIIIGEHIIEEKRTNLEKYYTKEEKIE